MKLPNFYSLKTVWGFCGFMFCFFQVILLSGQSVSGKQHDDHSVFLGNGALVYSDDVFFDEYLSHSTITNNDINVKIVKKEGNKLIVIVEKKSQSIRTDITHEFKKASTKIRDKEIAAIKKQITDFEKRKAKIKPHNINLPYSSFFQSNHQGNWNYVIPNTNSQKYSVAYLSEYIYPKDTSLDHLYSRGSTFYNSKIICYCFSTIYSVRPPPTIY